MNAIRIFLLIVFAVSFQVIEAREPTRNEIKRFVMKVVLGPEYGSRKEVVSQWKTAPTISVFGGAPEHKAVVADVVARINPLLMPSIGEIKILPDRSMAATMKIYFAPHAELGGIAEQHRVKYNPNDFGFFWMFWDNKNVIQSSIVLFATDKLSGNRLKHYAHEEIIQALGLAQDSDEFADSIFYAKGADGGAATTPSAMDLKLLEWFYKELKPGDNARTVEERFEATWVKSR